MTGVHQVIKSKIREANLMLNNGINIFYLSQPVESEDQAISLAQYLNQHGMLAYKSDAADHVVEIPMECSGRDEVADKSATAHTLIGTWKLYWAESDGVLFSLCIYDKD